MPATAALATLIFVAACSGVSEPADRPGARELLRDHLSVASAALAAGQPAVARRLYLSLAERFDDAPEPVLGLGYISLHDHDFNAARRQFLQAADLAQASPATRGEALLGAGRTALALGDTQAARQHLLDARALVQDPLSVMWIENGLAVAAVLEADYETAETHYTEALRNPSAHPRIAANFVRMLIASGRIDAAAGIYERYDASYWEEGDSRALQNLVDTARRQSMPPRRVDTRLLLEWPPLDPPPLIAGEGLGPSTGIALGGTLGLTLRLTGEAGWDVPPAADAVFAVPDNAGAPRPQPKSGGGEASALNRPSPKASFTSQHDVPNPYAARSAIMAVPGAIDPDFAAPPDGSPDSPVPFDRRRHNADRRDNVGVSTNDRIRRGPRSQPVLYRCCTLIDERRAGAGLCMVRESDRGDCRFQCRHLVGCIIRSSCSSVQSHRVDAKSDACGVPVNDRRTCAVPSRPVLFQPLIRAA